LVQALAMVTTALVFAARSGSKPAARNSTRDRFQ
jgi:ABC-type transporter Mla maintaining outer membrane lipid asymmetry permease subunit MlaE